MTPHLKLPVAVWLLLALLILTLAGCETTETKKPAALPAQAIAPTAAPPGPTKTRPPAPESQLAAKDNSASQPDPAAAVIAQAEREYAAGQSDYKAGHMEAAKASFDQAFNTLLSSNLDIRNNERLEQELDKIVEGTHELEMAALQQGEGFQQPRSEPAPIDEANDITFPIDPNIRAKAEAEIKTTKSDLPLVLNDQVAMFINYFSSPKGKATLENAWARAGRYRDMISHTLKQVGVPQDLIYLAQAESGFQPLAVSRAGARGIWQFMAGTAELNGLQRNWWVDDRLDPEKSTWAAARHLKDLYNQFGDWYLAMAAYNAGASTIQHAVERTGYADFWELYKRGVLPQETRNYVPIILAETIMAKNPEQYGLERVAADPPPKTDQVTIDYPVDLRLVAECVDSSVDYLQELNPSLLRMTTPKGESFTLNLPAGTEAKYQTAIAAIPQDMRTYWRYHLVEYGDTLPAIARKYHTSVSSIQEANNLSDDNIKAGAKLIIPIAPGAETVAYSHHPTRYRVRRGDTVASVADDFEVPVEKLRRWNHLRGNALKPGRILLIYKPITGESAEAAMPETGSPSARNRQSSKSQRTGEYEAAQTNSQRSSRSRKAKKSQAAEYHRVKKGETLSSIAQATHTSVAALKRDNPNLAANLRPGDVLIIRK
ncbi:MAG TPA: LysM peptidoglycan-binding domain-containing protein [Terriglobales bacterium]|nr:LysM peptidoglycan-binding domain-containing protein [Terriglobales bacterium]